jgi:hypothetical protein
MNEDYSFVARIIASCALPQHLEYLPCLISLFDRKYPGELHLTNLQQLYVDKQIEIGTLPH